MDLQKKISVARLCGKMTAARVAKAGGRIQLARIIGEAIGVKTGVTDFGEWTALTGQFHGTNLETGETMASAVCFLPDVALDLITAQLSGGAKAVEFAFDISVVADESSSVGFIYTASPILQAADNDPIKRLQAKIAALPAPDSAASATEGAPEGKGKGKGK